MPVSKTPMKGLFNAEYFDVYSENVGDTYRIFVGKPDPWENDAKSPVIFSLDGNLSFSSLLGTQRMLTQGGEVPSSYVIGIGYPGNTVVEAMARRNRDYLPTAPGKTELITLGGTAEAGGPAFLKFIQEELKPTLQNNYSINMSDSTLHGMSLGGLIATWTLLNCKNAFQKYIICSPAIWWRNEQVWEWEKYYYDNNNDLPASVFVGAGALEVEKHLRNDAKLIAAKNPILQSHIQKLINWNDTNGWPEVATLVPRLVDKLKSRNYSNLAVCSTVMPDENHMSVAPALTSRGLRFVNASWSPV